MGAMYLRYPDAAATLPDCWLWHPDLVEELLWLSHAWTAAYQGPDASVALAGDWQTAFSQVKGAFVVGTHLRKPSPRQPVNN